MKKVGTGTVGIATSRIKSKNDSKKLKTVKKMRILVCCQNQY